MNKLFSEQESDLKSEQNKEKRDSDISSVFLKMISDKRNKDPLIGAKLGSKEIFNRLLDVMKDEKGVHIQTLLCALGSLAGYSCQASIRSEFVNGKGQKENEVFMIVNCKDGKQYFFGDRINKRLVEDHYSVWSLVAGAVVNLGVKELIDIHEIFEYVTKTTGSNNFGIPRITDSNRAGDTPYNYVKYLWPKLLPVVKLYCFDYEWPILFGLAVQECIIFGKDVIDPKVALSIVMESAVPMSKIDLQL